MLAQHEMLAFGLRRGCPERVDTGDKNASGDAATYSEAAAAQRAGSAYYQYAYMDSSDEDGASSSDSDIELPRGSRADLSDSPSTGKSFATSGFKQFNSGTTGGQHAKQAAAAQKSAPYVFCNPDKATVLAANDMMYVLSPKPPKQSYGSWMRKVPFNRAARNRMSRLSQRAHRLPESLDVSAGLPAFAAIEDMLRGRGKVIQLESQVLPPTALHPPPKLHAPSGAHRGGSPLPRSNTGIPSMASAGLGGRPTRVGHFGRQPAGRSDHASESASTTYPDAKAGKAPAGPRV